MVTTVVASPVVPRLSKGCVTDVILLPATGLSLSRRSSVEETGSSTNSRFEASYCPTSQKVLKIDEDENKSDCIHENIHASSPITISKNISQINKFSPHQRKGRGLRESNNNKISQVEEPSKRAVMGKLKSSKYKGVVPQLNGRWGAQIYEKHKRVWLGTYNTEELAGRVYDIAAFKFRGRDSVTNFASLDESCSKFLFRHSKSQVVDMLRKHTFEDELQQFFTREYNANDTDCSSLSQDSKLGGLQEMNRDSHREHLFDKTVTPSDVGKLNRIVVPKQCAEKYFPLPDCDTAGKGVLLNFLDSGGKTWSFRYSYWKSSQSYVFTNGWKRYVNENGLQAGDTVRFERATVSSFQFYITLRRRASTEFSTNTLIGVSQKSRPPPVHITPMSHAYCIEVEHISLPREPIISAAASGCKKSASDDSSPCLEFKSLLRQSSDSSCSSSVMVFGANLSQSSPPVSLDFFPCIEAEKACRRLQQEKKRKWEGPVRFYDWEMQSHNEL